MERKKKRFYSKDSPVQQIYQMFGDQNIGVFIKFPKRKPAQIAKQSLFDLIVALRADDTEKIDYFLKTVKSRVKESSEGGESV